MISCLTVTQKGRENSLERAIYDFSRQSFSDKELVVLHDGGDEFHQYTQDLIKGYSDQSITVHQTESGKSLGELRNLSIDLARGDLICQWDDDDRYHSQRLSLQYKCLIENEADFCFLIDQLHYFQPSKELFWDDWNQPRTPLRDQCIQGTMLGSRELIGQYPSIEKGEDTVVTYELFDKGLKVVGLRDHGYLSMYQFTGINTWNFQHHGELAAYCRYRLIDLRNNMNLITDALNDMEIDEQTITLPHDFGSLTVQHDGSKWIELM